MCLPCIARERRSRLHALASGGALWARRMSRTVSLCQFHLDLRQKETLYGSSTAQPRRRRLVVMRRFLLFSMVVGFAAIAVPIAWAHLVYTDGLYGKYDVASICLGGTSAIAEGPPQAFVDVYSQYLYGGTCWQAKNIGQGKLGMKRQIYRKVDGSWKLCSGSGWLYNASATSYMSNSHQWTGGMPCGAGYYNNLSHGKFYSNGIWHGGQRWSGQHYFNPY